MEFNQFARAAHILFAFLWAGGAIYRAIVVEHVLKQHLEARLAYFATARHGPYMAITSTLAILAGGSLFADGDYSKEALGNGFFFFHLALGFAVLAYAIGWAFHLPNDVKLAKAAQARLAGEDAPMDHLAHRHQILQHVSAALIGLAVLGMLLFRPFF